MSITPPLALLFPGQGTEAVGMSSGWEASEPWVRTLEAAEACTGLPLRRWMREGPREELSGQRHAPMVLMAHAVGLYRAHREAGMPLPVLAAGHSLGFYCAAAAAEVVPLEAVLELVGHMEDLCEAAFGIGTHGMAFFIGLSELELRQALCGRPELALSNLNGQAQFTVSGPRGALEALLAKLGPEALKAGLLPVQHPLHGMHVVPLVPELARRMAAVRPREPRFPVLSHADGSLLTRGEAIWDAALVSAAQPVDWLRVVAGLRPFGAQAWECGYGQQLANLTRWADRSLEVRSLQDPSRLGHWPAG